MNGADWKKRSPQEGGGCGDDRRGWEEDYDYDDDCGCCAHVALVSCVVPASMSKSDVRHMFRNLLS